MTRRSLLCERAGASGSLQALVLIGVLSLGGIAAVRMLGQAVDAGAECASETIRTLGLGAGPCRESANGDLAFNGPRQGDNVELMYDGPNPPLASRSGIPTNLAARPEDVGPTENEERPPWETSDGTPCWGVECDFVEDPLPLDGLDPNDWGAEYFPWSLEPSTFDFENDECTSNCARFIEEIDRRVQACQGGLGGFLRGVFNACDRNDMEHELVRAIEAAFLEDNPEIEEALEADPELGAPVSPANVPTPRISAPREVNRELSEQLERRLQSQFDQHARQWFRREITPATRAADFAAWRQLIERASQSRLVVNWRVGRTWTHGYLIRSEGRYFFAQFDRTTGNFVSAFEPNPRQLQLILFRLGIVGGS